MKIPNLTNVCKVFYARLANRPFIVFDFRALWLSTLSTRVPESQKLKISPVRDWRSTPTYCKLQSHVTQKLGQKSKIRPR